MTSRSFTAVVFVVGATASCGPAPACPPHLASPSTPATAAPQPNAADALFLEMLRAYEALPTYEDRAFTSAWVFRANDADVSETLVESDVVFERPSRMRVRYRLQHDRWPAWAAVSWIGDSVESRSSSAKLARKWGSFEEAANALAGVSDEITSTIPLLLLGKNPWTCKGERPKVEYMGVEDVGFAACWKLRLQRSPCPAVVLWVAKQTNLIHKMSGSGSIDQAKSEAYASLLSSSLGPEAPSQFRENVRRSASAMVFERLTVLRPRANVRVSQDRFALPSPDGSP